MSLVCHWLGQTVKNCLCAVKTLKMTILPFWWSDQIFLWNYGPNLIKWFIWVHNVNVGQISWGLTVNLPQLTFFPIQLISRSTVQLTGQRLESRLETWYGSTWESNMKHESHLRHFRSKHLCANTNPNLGQQCKEESWAEQTLTWSWAPRVLWWENVKEMGGKILGYNSCPCSIFLNLKS